MRFIPTSRSGTQLQHFGGPYNKLETTSGWPDAVLAFYTDGLTEFARNIEVSAMTQLSRGISDAITWTRTKAPR